MTKDEALKMAIEAMETADAIVWEFGGVAYEKLQEALKICKEALKQPAQEPVAWEDKKDEWSKDIEAYHPVNTKAYADWDVAQRMVSNRRSKHDLTALVCWLLQTNKNDTHPHQWQGLTDDEIHNIADYSFPFPSEMFAEIFVFARAIEQALKEKNNA